MNDFDPEAENRVQEVNILDQWLQNDPGELKFFSNEKPSKT
jgi:hypothetical protein